MAKSPDRKNAIVLAMFGTSVESALPGLLHIRDRMVARYPQAPVRIAFTSKIIRQIWKKRGADPDYRINHPEVQEAIYQIQDPEETIANLMEDGIDSIVVQQVQIAPGRKETESGVYENGPCTTVTGTSGYTLTGRIVMGRPAMGSYDTSYPYLKDIACVARSLSKDVELARQEKAALFYMGHGNKDSSTSRMYSELVNETRRQYPDIFTVMILLEDGPSLYETMAELNSRKIKKVLLKPFMIVAGDHVRKDMVSNGPGSLQARLEDEGFTVVPVFKGLGEDDEFADIFVQHTADAARDAGIELR